MSNPTFRYLFDDAHTNAFQRVRVAITPVVTWATWMAPMGLLLSGVAGVLASQQGEDLVAANLLWVFSLLLVATVLLLLSPRLARHRARKSPLWHRWITVTLSETGLHEASENYEAALPWPLIQHAAWFEDGLVLNKTVWLPFAALAQGTLDELRELVIGHVRAQVTVTRTIEAPPGPPRS